MGVSQVGNMRGQHDVTAKNRTNDGRQSPILCACMSISLSLCVCAHVYLFVYVRMCVCVYVCMYVCVYVCGCGCMGVGGLEKAAVFVPWYFGSSSRSPCPSACCPSQQATIGRQRSPSWSDPGSTAGRRGQGTRRPRSAVRSPRPWAARTGPEARIVSSIDQRQDARNRAHPAARVR